MPGLSRSKQKRLERKAQIEKSLENVTFKNKSNDDDNTFAEPDSYSQPKSETKSQENEEKESG